MGQTGRVHDDPDRCYLAVQSRDPRFDGWFVTAVTSTGIYCRPSCPARTPFRRNVRFLPTAAAAQRAGFRACKRCRPDATPGSPQWDVRADVVGRAMRLIADGIIDRSGVPGLAAELGYSVRQLERLLLAEVGAGPVALARAQRAQTARVLIETTSLPMADVAFGAGFASIRQFNDTVAGGVRRPTHRAAGPTRRPGSPPQVCRSGALEVRLPFRRPLAPDNLFGHLAATAVPGVEEVVGATYRRTLRLAHGPGVVALTPHSDHIACRVDLADVADLTTAIARCRRLLDLDADPEAVDRLLGTDPALGTAGRRRSGSPGAPDDGRSRVRRPGRARPAGLDRRGPNGGRAPGDRLRRPVDDPAGGLTHLFPSAEELQDARPGLSPEGGVGPSPPWSTRWPSGRLDLGPGCDRTEARRGAAGPARRRPVDGRDGGHAGPRRPGCLLRRRPRRPAGGPPARSAVDPGSAPGQVRAVAAVAGLRRPVPVGHLRPSDQRLATRHPSRPPTSPSKEPIHA